MKGLIAYKKKDFGVASEYFNIALNLWNDLEVESGISTALTDLGNLNFIQENYSDAEACYIQAMTFTEEIDDEYGQALIKGKLGELAFISKNNELAEKMFTEELGVAQKIGHADLISHSKYGLARLLFTKFPSKALMLLEEIIKVEHLSQPKRILEIKNFYEFALNQQSHTS